MIDTLENDLKRIKDDNGKLELAAFKGAKGGEDQLSSNLADYD